MYWLRIALERRVVNEFCTRVRFETAEVVSYDVTTVAHADSINTVLWILSTHLLQHKLKVLWH